jgi:hypothetical protein
VGFGVQRRYFPNAKIRQKLMLPKTSPFLRRDRANATPSCPQHSLPLSDKRSDHAPRQAPAKRSHRMSETLCNSSLVDEQATRSQHARDFAECRMAARNTSADVITRTKVDNDVEGLAVERKIADVRNVQRRARLCTTHAKLGRADQRRIDVDTHELDWIEPLAKHRQCDAAPASDLEHSAPAREAQRPKHEWNLHALLESIA